VRARNMGGVLRPDTVRGIGSPRVGKNVGSYLAIIRVGTGHKKLQLGV